MTRPALRELIIKVVTSDPVARKVARAARLNERLANISVPADRILQGNILVPLNLTVNGIIQAGSTLMSATGIDLALLATRLSDLTENDANLSARISGRANAGQRGTLSFFFDSTNVERGVELTQSVSDTPTATTTLAAFRAGQPLSAWQNAYITVRRFGGGTPPGDITLGGRVFGQSGVAAQYQSGWLSIAAGATRIYSHNFVGTPLDVVAYTSTTSSAYSVAPMPTPNVLVSLVDHYDIHVTNNTSGTRWVRVAAWKDPLAW